MPILLDLFLTFAKIGAFTFGGGYAMLSVIDSICVDKKKWITHDEMMDVTVIAESTPGPISVNCATFVGFKQAGWLGGILATLGVLLPSFVVIYIISMFLDNFLEIAVIANAFKGIKIGVGILIVDAGITMLQKMKKSALGVTILVCSVIVMLLVDIFSLSFSSISLMLIAASVGFVSFLLGRKAGAAK
ncbi:MAG: chromate transporter [Oscillospiraceae bacterium]|nr:chromate transporter [Oscillospiraceae bacterium]MBQ9930377.1 chromate transporter [Oscillospiraceae bacterium]